MDLILCHMSVPPLVEDVLSRPEDGCVRLFADTLDVHLAQKKRLMAPILDDTSGQISYASDDHQIALRVGLAVAEP